MNVRVKIHLAVGFWLLAVIFIQFCAVARHSRNLHFQMYLEDTKGMRIVVKLRPNYC
jgi:hypothetical protein